jgi:uncharacterized membrane protein
MSMNQGASTLAPVSVGAVAEPFGIPAALLASAAFSALVLTAAMSLYSTRVGRMARPGEVR